MRPLPGRALSPFVLLAALVATTGAAPAPRRAVGPPRPARVAASVEIPAPIALSDPDGQDLVLEELSVKAAVDGMLSLTEMTLRFRNPRPRLTEGRFSCTLPAGSAVSRFAKEVDGRLMEGEVVERLRANQVYDEILHQMRDPALLETDDGNRFSARVFPIEANGRVRLVLSYTRLLPLENGVRTFSLPLRGLPTIGHFTFHGLFSALPGEAAEGAVKPDAMAAPASARVSTAQTLDLDESGFVPVKDVTVSFRPNPSAPAVRVLRAGGFVLTAFRPSLPEPRSNGGARSWVFWIDTSASGAEGMSHRLDALEGLMRALPSRDLVEIVLFDQEIERLGSATPDVWGQKLRGQIEKRGFLGGTDLFAALHRLREAAAKEPAARHVLVSDGVATLGKTAPVDLLSALEGLPGKIPLSALVLGAREDASLLGTLVAGRGRIVRIPFSEAMAGSVKDVASRLALPPGPTLEIADRSAEWIFPAEAHDVQAGSEILAIEKLRPGATPAARLVRDGHVLASASDALSMPAAAFEPLLMREGYRAYLDHLAAREAKETDPAVREALAGEEVKVSVAHRILIPRTTLLVLESEADYRRFNLDRRALESILTVGATGIERLDRASLPANVAARRVEADRFARGEGKERAQDAGKNELAEGRKDEAEATRQERVVVTNEMPAADASPAPREMRAPAAGTRGAAAPLAVAQPQAVAPPRPPVAEDRDGVGRSAGHASVTVPGPAAVTRPASSAVAVPADPPAWTRPVRPTADEIARLASSLDADPRDREAYNRLSDALFEVEDWKRLRDLALRWQPYDPENPQVYECLGEADLRLDRISEARRAFGSLVEIASGKPELLSRAGLLLFRAGAKALAETPLRRALELRSDRVNAYRHLALVLWQSGRLDEAAAVLESATRQKFPDWYGDAQRVVREELGTVYRAILAQGPSRKGDIEQRARERGVSLARRDALRATLAWETDANDVDLHVVDPNGEECFYGHRATASGLELYEDITRGLGPEVIRTSSRQQGTYAIGVNYFSAGPMGVSRGVLVVVRPNGGEDTVEILPFRLVAGSRDMRLLARVEMGGEGATVARVKR